MSTKTQDSQKSSGDYISRFEIITRLGSGGMGIVYKAHDPSLNKTVGLKVLKKGCLTNERQMRFQQEAKALKDLRHPAIPEIYNFAISEDEEPFLVMEYVEGTSLKNWLAGKGKRIAPIEAKNILLPICEALIYAHAHGVIHRDIKPDNIILAEGDYSVTTEQECSFADIKLIDFGLAKLEDDINKDQDMTQTGQIVGSPPYMSPEQIRGQVTNPASDIYSIGCVLYEMISGTVPYKGETALDTISKHLAEPTEICLEKLPDELQGSTVYRIIKTCLQKNPVERYDNIELLKADLEKIKDKDLETGLRPMIEIEEMEPTNYKGLLTKLGFLAGLLAFLAVSSYLFVDVVLTPRHDEKPKQDEQKEFISGQEVHQELAGDRDWQFIPIKRSSYWKGGENVTDEDFQKLIGKNMLVAVKSSSDKVTGKGIKYLKGTKLRYLSISSKTASNEVFKNAVLIPSLISLRIGYTDKVDKNGFKYLKEMPNLSTFLYVNSPIKPGMIDVLTELKSLEHLSLRGSTPLSTEDLAKITTLKRIHTLVLNGTKVDPNSLHLLKRMKSLKHLRSESLNIEDKVAAELIQLPLATIDFSGNPITLKSLKLMEKKRYARVSIIGCNKISMEEKKQFKQFMDNRGCVTTIESHYNPFRDDLVEPSGGI